MILWGFVVANILVLTGASSFSEGDLPRILYKNVANSLLTSSVTASSTDAASSVAYLYDDRIDRAWYPTSGTSHTITYEYASDKTINAFAIHGHNLGDITGCTVQLEAYLTGGVGYSVVYSATAVTTNRTFYATMTSFTASKLRVTIAHTGATLPRISALAIGEDMTCERGLRSGWADPLLARGPTVRPAVSRNGTPLPGVILDATLRQSFSLSDVSIDWAYTTWHAFRRLCDGGNTPFFLSWAPQTYPNRACYCSGAEFTGPEFSQKGYCNIGFEARMDAETGWVTE